MSISAEQKPSRVKYEEFLGMSLGRARGRLAKLILLELVKRVGDDECHRCGRSIESAEELSIDHKDPWRDVDPDLFWDMNNIAFSHNSCNSAAARRPHEKIGAVGTSWCSGHQEFLPEDNFGKGKRKNGLSEYCKKCEQERIRIAIRKHPRFPCPVCRYQMRKRCGRCHYELPMAEYMALRRKEGVDY